MLSRLARFTIRVAFSLVLVLTLAAAGGELVSAMSVGGIKPGSESLVVEALLVNAILLGLVSARHRLTVRFFRESGRGRSTAVAIRRCRLLCVMSVLALLFVHWLPKGSAALNEAMVESLEQPVREGRVAPDFRGFDSPDMSEDLSQSNEDLMRRVWRREAPRNSPESTNRAKGLEASGSPTAATTATAVGIPAQSAFAASRRDGFDYEIPAALRAER